MLKRNWNILLQSFCSTETEVIKRGKGKKKKKKEEKAICKNGALLTEEFVHCLCPER